MFYILCCIITFGIIISFMYTDIKCLNGYHHTLPGASNLIMSQLSVDVFESTLFMIMWLLCVLRQVTPLEALNVCLIFMLPALLLRMIIEFKAPDELYTVIELSFSPYPVHGLIKEKHKKIMSIIIMTAFIIDLIVCILSACQYIITADIL